MYRTRLRLLLPVILIVVVMALGFFVHDALHHEEMVHATTNIPWGPTNITDGAYYDSFMYRAYECKIPEDRFWEYAHGQGWSMKAVKGTPFEIRRYNWRYAENEEGIHVIQHGYSFQSPSETIGSIRIGYDTDSGYCLGSPGTGVGAVWR